MIFQNQDEKLLVSEFLISFSPTQFCEKRLYKLLKESLFNDTRNTSTTLNTIINSTCFYLRINKNTLSCKTRKKEIVYARHMIFWMIKEYLTISLQMTGNLIGGFDHATVLHGINKINKDLEIGYKKTQNAIRIITLFIFNPTKKHTKKIRKINLKLR